MATPEEYAISKTFNRDMFMVEKLERAYRENGYMHNKIQEFGGDASGLLEVRSALKDLYHALEEADKLARQHITQEDNEVGRMQRLAGIHKG